VKLLLATRNAGKLSELRELLDRAGPGVELLSLAEVPGAPVVEETGSTFAENAVLKARAIAASSALPTLADDSGLEVDALGGEPGLHSARYAGVGASDADRIRLLLARLEGVPPARRTARFRCAAALALPGRLDAPEVREGVCEGRILDGPRGAGGFGYDPVFFAFELGKTFAEAGAEEKNRVSHRARALLAMEEVLLASLGLVADDERPR
jgi:XTP/dITP diphosphohydrolase